MKKDNKVFQANEAAKHKEFEINNMQQITSPNSKI